MLQICFFLWGNGQTEPLLEVLADLKILLAQNVQCNGNVLKYTKYLQVRINQAKRLNITPSLDEKIQLYNMTEELLWADLDR